MRAAEVAEHAFLGVSALLGTDDHDRFPVQFCKAAHDRRVVSKATVAVHFQKVREDPFDVVQRVRAVRMTGKLNALPRGQVFVNTLLGFFQLFPECIQFGVSVKIVCTAEIFPFLQFFFQFSDGFFKIEDHICHNSYTPWRTSITCS